MVSGRGDHRLTTVVASSSYPLAMASEGVPTAGKPPPPMGPKSSPIHQQQQQPFFPKQKKCILKLDGYSYVIVASPPDKKIAKEESDVTFPSATSSPTNARNGELSKQSGGVAIVRGSTVRKSALTRSPRVQASVDDAELEHVDLSSDLLPRIDSPDACDKASLRLRTILRQLQAGTVPVEILQKNLLFAVEVLDSLYVDETRATAPEVEESGGGNLPSPVPLPVFKPRKLVPPGSKRWTPRQARRPTEDEDDLSEVQPDAVPPEVREWLASTFTRRLSGARKRSDEKPRFRSVAHAIRAGIFVERIYRRISSSSMLQFPPEVMVLLKSIDDWSFDVFAVNETSGGQTVRYIGYDLLNRYGIIHKFKISPSVLENLLGQIEAGYTRYKNPYHNNIHAADVTQTVHYMLCQTGLMHWLTDLEIFATLIAALTHDFEHTGTTNNFHVNSGSDMALLYNDRAVLENHHISATFKLMKEDENNILSNLSKEEYREFRNLVIDMVLATDMSSHFQQLKTMKGILALPDFSVDKSKALSLVLHCCDISHPAKKWELHFRWTELLLEEFFRQGDKEKELGLAYSPLCDRNNTHVPESQIGFIDFIVDPSLQICSEMLERVMATMQPAKTVDDTITEESIDSIVPVTSAKKPPKPKRSLSSIVPGQSGTSISQHSSSEGSSNTGSSLKKEIKKPWILCLIDNKSHWKDRANRGIEGFIRESAINEKPTSKEE